MSCVPAKKLINPSGKVYYHMDFEVILLFGLIEMTAQIAWLEKVSLIPSLFFVNRQQTSFCPRLLLQGVEKQ
jgi:hypothetical protein